MDYTKLLEKLSPKIDGEDTLRLRTGTVTTVNADGTLDITMSDGVLLPNVNKLATAYAPAGAVVQMIVFRGAMLVIGAVGSSAATGQASQSGTHNVTTASATTFSSAVVFPVAYPVGVSPDVYLNHSDGAAQAQLWIIHAASITNTGFNILGSRSSAGALTSSPVRWRAFV